MLSDDPLWYKDAVIYELHVRAFCDSVGDGMGDFQGLTSKLDYLVDLGVSALWILPFYPSPLRDDGYDIADYTTVNPDYGTLDHFKEFLDAAHSRGLRVITELVVNHTSDQHPWFQRARRAPPGSPERDFYVWSDTPDRYRDARIIFKDFETSNWAYDNVAKAYYWHRFYSHQPDLNFDNRAVWDALIPLCDYWFAMGVDGMRLDAIPYLYEREGTNCENLPETHVFLKALRKHVDEKWPSRMFLAEANQWPEDAVAYFGDGDECHMSFHFPLMPRLFMAIHQEDRFPVVDILQQTPTLPGDCQWAIFLRNHDELTLEMVTDEERDYMYRAYAGEHRARINLGIRRRLAPLMSNNRRRIELMNGLLFSLTGTPVLYYGDEIGMGDNIYLGDRNGVRTPMQWSADRNAGFSRANAQKLYLPIIIDPEYHYEAINVDAQQNNPNSLLWWTKRLISLRKQFKAFSRGNIQFLNPTNRRVLAFLRTYESETMLVVVNLSRFVQYVTLDLSSHAGVEPVELFGSTRFPIVTREPYLLTLGPHSFYWFALPAPKDAAVVAPAAKPDLHPLRVPEDRSRLFTDLAGLRLEPVLLDWLRNEAGAKRRAGEIRSLELRESFAIPSGDLHARMLVVDVEHREGPADARLVCVAFVSQEFGTALAEKWPGCLMARLQGDVSGYLCDATVIPEFASALGRLIGERRPLVGELSTGELAFHGTDETPAAERLAETRPERFRGEQRNVSLFFGNEAILKLYRFVEEGAHPEGQVGRYLTVDKRFPHAAPWRGELRYGRRRGAGMPLGMMYAFVPNEGDGWQYTLGELSVFFDRVITLRETERGVPRIEHGVLTEEPRAAALELISGFAEPVRILARRTAELHSVLADGEAGTEFAAEEYSGQYQRSMYQSMRKLVAESLYRLKQALPTLPENIGPLAREVAGLEVLMMDHFHNLIRTRLHGRRIVCHGDYHLGQFLFLGNDFKLIDFEGSPLLTLGERKIKRSPVRDVASLLRSFDYAALSALYGFASGRGRPHGLVRSEDFPLLESWTHVWRALVKNAFLSEYRLRLKDATWLPPTEDEWSLLLDVFLLEKMLLELLHELEHHPTFVRMPLEGLIEHLGKQPESRAL